MMKAPEAFGFLAFSFVGESDGAAPGMFPLSTAGTVADPHNSTDLHLHAQRAGRYCLS
jgi:hypothetical protein